MAKVNEKYVELSKQALEHWHENLEMVKGGDPFIDISGSDCAYCRYTDNDCESCPIGKDAGVGCTNTPWMSVQMEICELEEDRNSGNLMDLGNLQDTVERMIAYLEGLDKRINSGEVR